MNGKLKIGYLVPQFPGQTHIFFWREIAALEKLGVEVQVFSTRLPPSGLISHDWSEAAIARTRYLGAPLADLPLALAQLPLRPLLDALRRDGRAVAKDALICAPAARKLARDCRALGITHVHAHSCGRAAMIAALARGFGGVPYSLTLHGPLQDYGVAQRFKWRGAKFATIITQKLLAQMQAEPDMVLPERLVVQPMGVETEALKRPTPYQPAQKGAPVRLFSCGRLNIVKGHQDLMQAVAILAEQGMDVRLDIAGEDDAGGDGYRRELEAHLVALNLQSRVTLLGAISAEQVRRYLHQAHVFVLASWAEPLGVAYMEAMAAGVPTIGTNAGGVPELITNGVTGHLVPPQDPASLAKTIAAVIANPQGSLDMAEAGRKHIEARFGANVGAEVLAREITAEVSEPVTTV